MSELDNLTPDEVIARIADLCAAAIEAARPVIEAVWSAMTPIAEHIVDNPDAFNPDIVASARTVLGR